MDVEIGATKDGKVKALKVDDRRRPRRVRRGRRPDEVSGRPVRHRDRLVRFPDRVHRTDAYFTNKAPGGIAYRCSFRVTEASYAIERGMDILAEQLGMDPAELRRKNFVQKEQFPYHSPLGFVYDSGDYHRDAAESARHDRVRRPAREQAEKRKRGELMGIGISTFTEVVGAGPGKHFDIIGIKMFDRAEIRIHPTGFRHRSRRHAAQGQGHETTWAQIVAEELGLDPQHLLVEEGDTDTAPYGLGHLREPQHAGRRRGTRAGGAPDSRERAQDRRSRARGGRRRRRVGRLQVPGQGRSGKSDHDEGRCVRGVHEPPPGQRARLEATFYYDPPNLTFPQRRVRGGRRRRSRDRRSQRPALRCGRRLRHHHQPDDRRRADSRRAHRRLRDRVHAGDPLRRRAATTSTRTSPITWYRRRSRRRTGRPARP